LLHGRGHLRDYHWMTRVRIGHAETYLQIGGVLHDETRSKPRLPWRHDRIGDPHPMKAIGFQSRGMCLDLVEGADVR
jgi:hypothetical protein